MQKSQGPMADMNMRNNLVNLTRFYKVTGFRYLNATLVTIVSIIHPMLGLMSPVTYSLTSWIHLHAPLTSHQSGSTFYAG